MYDLNFIFFAYEVHASHRTSLPPISVARYFLPRRSKRLTLLQRFITCIRQTVEHQHGWYTSNPTCILAIERERDSNGLRVANCCQSTISKFTDLDGEFCRNESQKNPQKTTYLDLPYVDLSFGGDFEKYIYEKKKKTSVETVRFVPASPDATSPMPRHRCLAGQTGAIIRVVDAGAFSPKPHFFGKRSTGWAACPDSCKRRSRAFFGCAVVTPRHET